ncbi:type II secretion system protein [Candidatus Uhrbacteria bacterium]|nr:type II secretion system protein [Candidatus Uhrbacteria bacterium]
MNTRGFTLVELLVAVGIIGVLASVSMFSISEARAKARDTRRVQDVRELSKALDIYATTNPQIQLENCVAQGAGTTSCTIPADFPMADFAKIKDPSGSATRCGRGVGTACQYTFGNATPTVGEYEICFKFERKSSQFGASDENLYRIGPGQLITPGCDYQP